MIPAKTVSSEALQNGEGSSIAAVRPGRWFQYCDVRGINKIKPGMARYVANKFLKRTFFFAE